jgi:hypothetical protein
MALIDSRILQNTADPFGSALQGYNQGQQIRDARMQREQQAKAMAEQQKQQEQERIRQQSFQQNLNGLLGSYGEYAHTPEGQRGLFADMSKAGFGREMMGLMGGLPQQPKPQQQEYQFKEFGDQAVTFNPATGQAQVVPGMKKAEKPTGPTPYEIAKDAWERSYKERQLKQAGGDRTKDNELAAAKFELTRTKTEADMARKATDVDEVAAQADAAVSLIDQMIGSEDGKSKRHPGFKGAVGAKGLSSFFGLKDKPIAGTDAAGFAALYDQVKGGAFLEAVQKMKGSGALSDTEGKAAANAITRMQTSTSEAEFEAAAKEFRAAIKGRKGRVMEKAAKGAPGLIVTPHPADSSAGWSQIAPGIRVRQR